MQSEELKPCPFCGGPASIEQYGDRSQSTIYNCDNCSCSLETGEEFNHGAQWNCRAEAALSAAEPVALVIEHAARIAERYDETDTLTAPKAIATDIRALSTLAATTEAYCSEGTEDDTLKECFLHHIRTTIGFLAFGMRTGPEMTMYEEGFKAGYRRCQSDNEPELGEDDDELNERTRNVVAKLRESLRNGSVDPLAIDNAVDLLIDQSKEIACLSAEPQPAPSVAVKALRTAIHNGLIDGARLESDLQSEFDRTVDSILASVSAALSAQVQDARIDDDEETYQIGVRDGYSQAVQEIDRLTGGDGEYRYCTDHDPERHTPGPAEMIQRIVDRFETLNLIGDAEKRGDFWDVPGSAQVQDVAGWQSMDTAPKDGSEFAAGRRYSPDGEFVVHTYRWVGPPNYWNSKRNGVCIRPSYQDDYMWCPLPAAPAKQEGGSNE